MFRYKVGTKVLLQRNREDDTDNIFEVEILAKAPHRIKALALCDGWFRRGSIHWLSDSDWQIIDKVKGEVK